LGDVSEAALAVIAQTAPLRSWKLGHQRRRKGGRGGRGKFFFSLFFSPKAREEEGKAKNAGKQSGSFLWSFSLSFSFSSPQSDCWYRQCSVQIKRYCSHPIVIPMWLLLLTPAADSFGRVGFFHLN